MSDLISRQAAIDAARDWYEGLICGSFKGLEKRLRALPSAQPEQRWIPCTERMPETGHEYLYCTDMGTVHMGFYWGGLGFGYGFDYGYDIVAWMPLPQPYKGEKHG